MAAKSLKTMISSTYLKQVLGTYSEFLETAYVCFKPKIAETKLSLATPCFTKVLFRMKT